jgi:TldD protein
MFPPVLSSLPQRGDFSEIFMEESSRRLLSFQDGRPENVSVQRTSGAGVRVVEDGSTRFSCLDLPAPVTGGISDADVKKIIRLWGGKPGGKARRECLVRSGSACRVSIDPADVPLTEKAALLARADRAARIHPDIRQVSLTLADRTRRVSGVSAEGPWREDRSDLVFFVQVTAERGGVIQTATEVLGGLRGWELFQETSPEVLAQIAARRALEKLDAPPAPIGEMAVVLAAEAGGTMIHEAVGHALEADAILEGSSPHFAGKVGTLIAHPKVTVVDDPTLVGWRGSFVFDDEGVASGRTVLIENGVLKGYMHDRLSARRGGSLPNGHGRRESYKFKPIPRMSNTFVTPGTDDPKEIVGSLSDGLLITRMGGGQVNTTTGEFVFEVEEGFRIRDGKVAHRVRGANLLGSAPDVLLSIDRVGSDMGWGVGTCGKSGQGVPVSDGLPTLRIPKILVGGREE